MNDVGQIYFRDWNFLKTFETEKEALGFNENLIESLNRKIMVKLYCPWCNVSINLIAPNNTWALCEHLYKFLERKVFDSNDILLDTIF